MKSILVKPFSKLTNLILLSGAIFVLAACSDSTYNVPGDDDDCCVQPPPPPEPLSVVVSGVVVDQVTGNVISASRVDFFEGLEKATNIILPDGTATDGEDLANGSFQVSAGDIDQFRVEASANGYAYNSVIVNVEEKITNLVEGTEYTITSIGGEPNDDNYQDILTAWREKTGQSLQDTPAVGYEFVAQHTGTPTVDGGADMNGKAKPSVVYVIVDLLGDGFEKSKEVFTDSVGEDFAVKAEGITLTSDDSADDKTTEGQAEVVIAGGIQFLDENDQVIEVAAVNLEVSYIETQEATEEDEVVLSIADLIPEGLNSDNTIEEVLVPVGVTEVNMTDENGTPIKNFSGDITITLYLPATTIDPATGSPITTDSNFRVRTYDAETQVWTTEPEDAVTVLAQQGDLFPVEVTVDHLTIFALTAEVTACANDATLNFTGSAVPATPLELVVEAGDLRQTYAISESSFVISKDDILKDEDGYKVYVTDSSGVSWLAEEEEADSVEPEEPQVPATVITVPTQLDDTQHVYVSESTLSEDGTQVTLKVSYMADEANLSGVGITVNYDSSVLTLNEISDVFAGAIASGSQSEDSEDSDLDSATDQKLSFGWASLFGQFPGSNSVDLATITFDIAADAVGSTDVNIAASSSAAGYTFDGQSQSVGVAAEAAEPVSDGYTLCAAEATTINLEAPAQPVTYSKNLDLVLQCTNDSLVTTDLANAVVIYSSDTNPIPQIALESSAGSYELTELTEGSVYTVTVNTRTNAGIVVYDQSNNGILTDGANETRNIGISCSTVTGTGTGSGSI